MRKRRNHIGHHWDPFDVSWDWPWSTKFQSTESSSKWQFYPQTYDVASLYRSQIPVLKPNFVWPLILYGAPYINTMVLHSHFISHFVTYKLYFTFLSFSKTKTFDQWSSWSKPENTSTDYGEYRFINWFSVTSTATRVSVSSHRWRVGGSLS